MSSRGGTVNTLAENILLLIDKRLTETHVSMPAKINSYDSAKQRAEIEILVKQKAGSGGKAIEQAVIIPDVPVIFPAATNTSFITFPVGSGTLGEVRFSDVALDTWMESDGSASLSTKLDRSHDFSDCYFSPGLRPPSQKLDGFSSSATVIRQDGTKIEVGDETLKIENSTAELVMVLSDLVDTLSAATVTDPISGELPFNSTVVTALNVVKAKIDSFI